MADLRKVWGAIEENQIQGWGQVESHIKPPNWISQVRSSSGSEATSGLGATLQGGGHHSLLATTIQVTNHRESDYLHGSPGG